jgi:transposase-like protein
MATQRKKGERNRYSDDDRAFALRWLDVRRGNVNRTARELGCPVQTLHQWARGERIAGAIARPPAETLTHLRVFRGRCLPVACEGAVIPLDLSRLTGKQHELLLRLLARARTDPRDGTG